MNQSIFLNRRALVVLAILLTVIGWCSQARADVSQREDRASDTAWSAPQHTGRGGSSKAQVIGSRPAGCPSLYCGCALSLKLFGKIIPDLNLAANWRHRFASTSAQPGMVGVKPGGSHVLQLVSQVEGNRWMVWTANSCKGRICIQERNVANYTFLNPQARMASR